jgi:hypothetical protein
MVHKIVTAHLQAYLRGENPPQCLMIVHGQGGTGKSALVNAISQTFVELGAPALLAKTAMSGVAASIIGRQTLHSWASLPIITPTTDRWLTHPGKDVEKRQKNNMESVLWLIVDEKSMMTMPLLHYLSQATGIVCSSLMSIEPSIKTSSNKSTASSTASWFIDSGGGGSDGSRFRCLTVCLWH